MLTTNRILLFIITLTFFALVVGFELALILIVTALICFNSYEPFVKEITDAENETLDLDGNELSLLEGSSDCQAREEERLSSPTKSKKSKGKGKMSRLWKPRVKTSEQITGPGTPNPSLRSRDSGLTGPSCRPPIRFTDSPFSKSILRQETDTGNDQENLRSEPSQGLWGSPYKPAVRGNTANQGVHNRSLSTSAGPLLSSPFLPRVKRAIGIGQSSMQLQKQAVSPRRSSYGVSGGALFSSQPKPLPYPSPSSPGWVPLVRLGRHEKPVLQESNTSMIHSPVTVKIAAPSPHKLNSTRLSVSTREDPPQPTRKPPDTETILSALREKSRKRGIASQDESLSETSDDQQVKRRKQDDSTSSSSSMISEPEFMSELPVNGYSNIPLHMVGMKRPATPTMDLDQSATSERMLPKKPKGDNRNNPIFSSLSSSRRGVAKEMMEFQRPEKRKPTNDHQSDTSPQEPQSKTTKTEIITLCDASSTPMPERPSTLPRTDQPEMLEGSIQPDMSSVTTLKVTSEQVKAPQSPKKKLLFDTEKTGRKGKMPIYSGLNLPMPKVASFDVTTNPDDYDRDRQAEHQRALDMLQDIQDEEKEKLKKELEKKQQQQSLAAPKSSAVSGGTGLSTAACLGSTLSITGAQGMSATISTTTTSPASTSTLTLGGSTISLPKSAGFQTNLLTSTVPASSTLTTSTPAASSVTPLLTSVLSAPTESVNSGVATFTVPSTATPGSVTSTQAQVSTTAGLPLGAAPPYTFKPVFPSAVATNVPSTAASGGFSYNQAKTDITKPSTVPTASTSTSMFASTTATSATATTTKMFSLGVSATEPSAFTGSVRFGTPGQTQQQTPAMINNFSLGQQQGSMPAASTATVPGLPVPSFNFGASATTTTANSGFSFGTATTSAVVQSSSAAPVNTTSNVTTGFAFGVPPATSAAQPKSLLSFGSSQVISNNTSVTNQAGKTQASGFAFGAVQPTTTATTGTAQASLFSFGGGTATTKPPTGFNFGTNTTSSTTTQPTVTNNFNIAAATTTAPNTNGFSFGQSAKATTTTKTTTIFGQNPATGSMFGSTAQTTSSNMFDSAAVKPATTTTSSSMFGGSGSGFSFSSNPAPSFGSQTTTANAGGSFQFGQANVSSAATNQPFGMTSSSGKGFAFGTSGTSSTTGSGSVFGTKPIPTFGTTTQANQNSGSMFGGTASKPMAAVPTFRTITTVQANQSSAFGSQQPSFGQATMTNSSSSGFGIFGSSPSTSFSTTQQQSSTGAFGAVSSTTNTGSQGVLAFGQSSSQPPSTPVKGFDFSAAVGGIPNLGFSSSTPAQGFGTPIPQTPVMNFGTGGSTPAGALTPGFGGGGGGGGGGMFSVGSGAISIRPRSRARRKGAKR